MATLTVSVTTDFSDRFLHDIDQIDFINPSGSTAIASFAATQFAWGLIGPYLGLTGSAGINVLSVTGHVIDAGQWHFQSWGGEDKVILTGTMDADSLQGGYVSTTLFGRGGADEMVQYGYPEAGSVQRFFGGGGDDRLTMQRGLADGGGGEDMLIYRPEWNAPGLSVDLSDGGGGRLLGALAVMSIERLDFLGSVQDDTVTGGTGADLIRGDHGADLIAGGAGNDQLVAGYDQDVLGDLSYDENDRLFGGAGDDSLWANKGLADGGEGNDLLYFDASGAGHGMRLFVFDGGGGRVAGGLLEVSSIEQLHVSGTGYADTIAGGDAFDVIAGGFGADVLRGKGGSDFLRGGTLAYWQEDPSNAENDSLYGGDGDDTLSVDKGLADGGAGNDELIFSAAGAHHAMRFDIADGGGGRVYGLGVTIRSIERVDMTATDFADRIRGGDLSDTIRGGLGADRVIGGDGNDLLIGGADDPMAAGDGNDTILGGAGDDILLGSLGADILTGGDGADRFAFLSVEELGLPLQTAPSPDVITDFQQGQDKIDLSRLFFAPYDQALDVIFICQTAFYGSSHLEVRFFHTQTDTLLEFGRGFGVLGFVQINGLIDLTADDFLL